MPSPSLNVGDLVYLFSDKDKSRAYSRYLIVTVDGEWCYIKKITGNQLRANSFKVKLKECYKVPLAFVPSPPYRGWSGGAMVLGKLPVPGRPTILITVGQGPMALAVGAGGGGLDIFTLIYPFSSFSLSLGDGSILTEILSQRAVKPKTTNQPSSSVLRYP